MDVDVGTSQDEIAGILGEYKAANVSFIKGFKYQPSWEGYKFIDRCTCVFIPFWMGEECPIGVVGTVGGGKGDIFRGERGRE